MVLHASADCCFIIRSFDQSAMIDIGAEEIAQNEPDGHQQEQEQRIIQQHQQRPMPVDELDIFDEINNHYLDQQRNGADNNNNNYMAAPEATADAELTLYQQEPTIQLREDEGGFSCPLTWWKFNARKYKLLSILASRVLCIPATSAPSERVFSTAGLTIAKDRARLASEMANELIFLHEL